MDVQDFLKILRDKHFPDYKRLSHKYKEEFPAFLKNLEAMSYHSLPLSDRGGKSLIFTDLRKTDCHDAMKAMLGFRHTPYGLEFAEEEILATSRIENIDFSRDSVREILRGRAPKNEQELRIEGMKNAIRFIADGSNHITEENLHTLYEMTVGKFLDKEKQLRQGAYYRHDAVYVVGSRVEHVGLPASAVSGCMKKLVAFANAEDDMNDLVKAAVLHFYLSYVHPYFDGNGRMARLLHLWFLVRRGYRSILFMPFSCRMEESRKEYYQAFSQVEENKTYSGVLDVTPFAWYCMDHIYKNMMPMVQEHTFSLYSEAMQTGQITEKQAKLWQFVVSSYGMCDFSTKQLEKDFGDAAYATIRDFVLKFERLGLLSSTKYATRVKYRIR